MERPNFRITFIPKQGDSIKHLENLILKEELKEHLSRVLKQNKITPEQISITKTGAGRGKKGELFEGYFYKKYIGKISGERKTFFNKKPFITRFDLSLLKGLEKDGFMFESMDQHGIEDAKLVTDGIYNLLLGQIGQQGPVPFSNITSTGTF